VESSVLDDAQTIQNQAIEAKDRKFKSNMKFVSINERSKD
jgi:hypothetical protein